MSRLLNSTTGGCAYGTGFDMQEQSKSDVQEVDQSLPKSLLICCSDSPINQALLHRSNPGELLILKSSANTVPVYGTAGGDMPRLLDFAINELGIRNVIVCGHSCCQALASKFEAPFDATPTSKLAPNCEPESIKQIHDLIAQENVLKQLENLKSYPFISDKLRPDSHAISLSGWVISQETGVIHCYRRIENRFVPWVPRTD